MSATDRKKFKRILAGTGIAALVIIASALVINFSRIERFYKAVTLFNHDVIAENFRTMGPIFGSKTIHKGADVFSFKRRDSVLPAKYLYRGEEKSTAQFLETTETTGFIVVRDDTILYEKYYRGNNETSRAISWSVCKSFVSALMGIAISEGYIKDVNQKVTDYVPRLAVSGYNGVKIKDVLQMSSGVGFNEDYGDFNSDINRLGRAFALNTTIEDFILTLKQEKAPGTFNQYVSMDTQVIGMIISAATKRDLTSYIEEKLWKPIGMESDALWLVDSSGMEIAFGGLNVTLRDYARFGRLYLNNGRWNGRQVVPASWIKQSLTPDADHLKPGKRANANHAMGYGYQWWIPENPKGDFLAIGIYGQAIYVNPARNIVIARTSAYSDYTKHVEEMETEEVEMFRTIADKI